jgi:branched-chain amino acid transport system permease protein
MMSKQALQVTEGSARTATRRPWMTHRSPWLIALIVAAVAFYTTNGSSYSIYVLDTVLLAAIGAFALDLLMGTGGQVSLGNAAFLAVGAYTTVWAVQAGVAFPLDVILGGVMAGLIGLFVGIPALRIRGMYLALATLAAFYIVGFFVQQYQTKEAGAAGFFLTPVFSGDIVQQQTRWAWLLAATLALTIVAMSWLRSGRSGRAWRMIREHELASSIMGIPVARYKLILFVVSSAIIGIQGGLTARFTGSVTHESFTLALSISAVAMILIGGLDTAAGPLVGAAVIMTLPLMVPEVIGLFADTPSVSADAGGYAQIVYGILIVVFIVGAPKGLSGLVGKAFGVVISMMSRPDKRTHDGRESA